MCPVAAGQNSQANSLYLTGRVILDDGWAPDERADIVATCNGQSYVAAHTDKSGLFGFRLGASGNRTLQDASTGSADGPFGRSSISMGPQPAGSTTTTSSTDPTQQASGMTTPQPSTTPSVSGPRNGGADRALMRCDLQAKLPGYQSESISLANRKQMDNPDLGTIILHRLAHADGNIVSVAALAAPKDARRAFDKGRKAAKANRPEEARQDFEKATRIYPQYAAAWCELGKLQIAQRQLDEAHRLFETAIHADPKHLDSYLQLAALQAMAGQWPELAATTGAALRLDPRDYPQAYYLDALANFNLRNTDAAERSAREAERLDPRRRFPGSWQVLSRILMMRRQFAEAAVQMREYLRIAPRAPDALAVRARLTEIEKLSAAAPGATPE
jgi:tetratricopeptide (TPR) repeat protein